MNYRNASLVGSATLLFCLGVVGCSNSDSGPAFSGQGGMSSSGTGGVATSTAGGASPSGGATASGGQVTQGGSSSQGGAQTGGTSRGGAATGGAATGGAATGGAAMGGAATGGAATGGAVTGGAATGGSLAEGGATSSPVVPTKVTDADYRFTMTACNNVVMDVNPQIGARVTKLAIGSTNVINPYTCTTYSTSSTAACPNNAGSTFWTSPQSAWDGNASTTGDWPPVPEVDGSAYTPSITSSNHLVATGTANSSLGASVTKDFSADAGTCWVTLLYTIKATKAIQVAPWEITRVPRGGIALFPLGDSAKLAPGPLASYTTTSTTTTPSVVWFDDSSKAASNVSGSKLVADGASGWFAYALGGNLFVKKYPDVLPAAFATGEGDVEGYADTSGYLELEVQGAYTSLASGASLPWTVQWRVVAIPSSVTVAVGSSSLVTFVQQQVAM